MSVTGNIIGMPPGAGGSFPMAGTRPKVRKTLTITSGSIATWAAPPNVYHIILEMCGGGGGGSVGSNANATSQGGGGGGAIPPSVIPVNPGSVYRLVAGLGGVQRSYISVGDGFNGTPSEFTGDTLRIIAPGGRSGSNSGPANFGSIVNSSLGYIGVNGGSGGVGFATGSRVENQLGGVGSQYLSSQGAGGGGASLYASGSNAGVNATGFGAGGGAGFADLILNAGAGGPGFVRIIWEE